MRSSSPASSRAQRRPCTLSRHAARHRTSQQKTQERGLTPLRPGAKRAPSEPERPVPGERPPQVGGTYGQRPHEGPMSKGSRQSWALRSSIWIEAATSSVAGTPRWRQATVVFEAAARTPIILSNILYTEEVIVTARHPLRTFRWVPKFRQTDRRADNRLRPPPTNPLSALGPILVEQGPRRVEPNLTQSWPSWARSCSNRARCGRAEPNSDPIQPNSSRTGSTSGQTRPNSCRTHPNLGRAEPVLGRPGPIFAEQGKHVVDHGPFLHPRGVN